MKLQKLYPPFTWRYLAQQAFHRAHPQAPLLVANAVILLDSWLRPCDRGLEWGSGRSTTWLAGRLAQLVSVEHDRDWHERVRCELDQRGLSGKVDYRLVRAPGGQLDEPVGHAYAAVADEIADGSMDLVLVDGQMRLRCAEKGIDKVKPGGLLVLDGANRYVANVFEGGHTTIQVRRDQPLSEEWRRLLDRLRDWRAINTSDGLWDTRMWVRPG